MATLINQGESMNRYRTFFGVLLAVFLLAGCAGREALRAPVRDKQRAAAAVQPPAQAQPEAAAAAQEDHICLWKIAAPENTVYLLGSLHLLRPEDYPLDSRYGEAYRSAEKVVFETDLDALEAPEFLGSMLAQAMYSGGRTLKTELPAALYAELAEVFAGFNMSMDRLDMLRPWFLSMTLATLHMLRMGYDPTLGIDRYFYEQAKRDGKTLGALETPEYQVGLMASFSELDQEALLRESLLELEQLGSIITEIRAAWQSGDLEAIDLLNQSMKEFPVIHRKLIADRNRNWTDLIVQYLQGSEDCLVIVGAAHMPGDEGLISLLRARGYAVSRY
jgi:uncharacterized protein YbaP (TraB family)